jgi:hypothetical protein
LFNVGGRSVNWLEADTPLSVAVSVITVGDVTCPNLIGNSAQACPPSIENVEGTGARAGCELASAIVAPPDGTAALSCSASLRSAPLYSNASAPPRTEKETGVAGAELIVKRPVADQSVSALVVGDESPCCERTRQNLGPDVSDNISWVGSVYWL